MDNPNVLRWQAILITFLSNLMGYVPFGRKTYAPEAFNKQYATFKSLNFHEKRNFSQTNIN